MNSIKKSIEILNFISNAKRSVGITEISKNLLFPKSSVYRILNSLLDYSLIDRVEDTSKYRLGLQVLKYSNSFCNSFDLNQIAKPILKKVCIESNLTTFLSIWNNNRNICIDSVKPFQELNNVQLFVEVGKEIPLHCTASSKVILANQSLEDMKIIINKEPLFRYTQNTIIEPKKLIEHLLEIRKKGYSICDQEHQEGIKAIAAPIKNIKGKTIGSIAVVGLAQSISSNNLRKLTNLVIGSAKEISKKLGYDE